MGTMKKVAYTDVIATLNEHERNRLLCALLNTKVDEFKYDENKAAEEFGSGATGPGFKTTVAYTLKRVVKGAGNVKGAGDIEGAIDIKGAIDGNGNGDGKDAGDDAAHAAGTAVATTPAKDKGRKRKAADGDTDRAPTPKKPRAHPKEATAMPQVEEKAKEEVGADGAVDGE